MRNVLEEENANKVNAHAKSKGGMLNKWKTIFVKNISKEENANKVNVLAKSKGWMLNDTEAKSKGWMITNKQFIVAIFTTWLQNMSQWTKSEGWMLNDTENLNVKYATMNNWSISIHTTKENKCNIVWIHVIEW